MPQSTSDVALKAIVVWPSAFVNSVLTLELAVSLREKLPCCGELNSCVTWTGLTSG